MSFPDASTPRTTKLPDPSWRACTISGSERLPGSPTCRSPKPSIGTTVVAGDADGVVVPDEHGADVGTDAFVTASPEHAVAAMIAISTADTVAGARLGRLLRSVT